MEHFDTFEQTQKEVLDELYDRVKDLEEVNGVERNSDDDKSASNTGGNF